MVKNLNPPAVFSIYAQVRPYLSSLRVGGVVGDARHVAQGSYHVSRDVMRANGLIGHYSMKAPADLRGPGGYAAAIDLSLNPAQMVSVSRRLDNAMKTGDPRIEPTREYIGTFNGRDVCGWNRYDSGGTGSRSRVGHHDTGYGDDGHLWHVHLSVFRAYVLDRNRTTGIAEVVAGLPAGKLGWRDPGIAEPPILAPILAPVVVPKPLPAKPTISLSAATIGMLSGGAAGPNAEVKLIQKALGLLPDGYYGPVSRAKGANFQVTISDLPKPTPWPKSGWDADADGILGKQSLTGLGFTVTP